MRQHALMGARMVLFGLSIGTQEKVELRSDMEVYPLVSGIWRHVTYRMMEEWGWCRPTV